MNDLVLTIDCGTTGMRAVIFDSAGNECLLLHREFTGYYSSTFGYHEAPASMFWDSLTSLTQEIAQDYTEYYNALIGMTVSTQRDTSSIVDKNGETLRDFISWQDRRTLDHPMRYRNPFRTAFNVAGLKNYVDSFNVAAHANWIAVNEPDLWKQADKFVFISTYLIGKLVGRIVDSKASVAGHVPYDFKNKKWCGKLDPKMAVIPIPREKLFDLCDALEIIGEITSKAAAETGLPKGLPVIASGTDKGCEALGVGAISPDTASISLGTQSTICVTTDKYFEMKPFFPSFPAVDPQSYNPESITYCGFWMMRWFIKNFLSREMEIMSEDEIYKLLDRELVKIPPGSEGLILQPYWGQEVFKPEARGAIIGFTESQNKFHVFRSIVEGIIFSLREGLEKIEKKTGITAKSVGLSGGGSNSDAIAQIIADILGREVYRIQTNATTGFGGAMATFTGMGVYRDLAEAKKHMVRKTTTFFPDMKSNKLYNDIYTNIYSKLYSQLKPFYKLMQHKEN